MSLAARILNPAERSEAPSPAWADDRLVRGCLEGDQRAWNALIDKYKRLIYSVAFRYHATPDDAADIFQSVCLELYGEVGRLRDPAALRGWLITVASHSALRWRRASVRRDGIERTDGDVTDIGDPRPNVEADREELERAQELRDAIARLPDRCRAMVQMLFFEDPPVPYADVAARLGLATGSIGFIRGRCLDKLRKVVSDHAGAAGPSR